MASSGQAEAGGAVRGPARPDGAADPEAAARQVCLRMLTATPRTRAELEAALHRRGIPAEAADAVLGRFAEVGLIDDATFARAWVESRHHGRGLSGRALAGELRRKGVPADDIKAAVAGLDPEHEVATARALVGRRLAATRGQPPATRVRRLTGILARKGYPQALAYRLVREALEREALEAGSYGVGRDGAGLDGAGERGYSGAGSAASRAESLAALELLNDAGESAGTDPMTW